MQLHESSIQNYNKHKSMVKEQEQEAYISIGIIRIGIKFHTRSATLCLHALDLFNEVWRQPYNHAEIEGIAAGYKAEGFLNRRWRRRFPGGATE